MTETKTFFGHPRGLATLFFTEMWERFSYYGMRALLLLFMVSSAEKGGMALDEKTAGAIYGLYTMGVYLMSLPGGWLADKFLGLQRSVFYGGCFITLGHVCLAFPFTETFFTGLLLIVVGTGMLKPNISSLVGELYSKDDSARRDAGFSIFYIGINIGATIAPFITSYLGEKINWHYGFAAAGVGMAMGVIQYRFSSGTLGEAGKSPALLADPQKQRRRDKNIRVGLMVLAAFVVLLLTLLFRKVIYIDPVTVARASTYVIIIGVIAFFLNILFRENLDADEKKKIGVIAVFFMACTAFYGGYEQQGSTLTLFADRYTDKWIGNFEIPSGWFQTLPPISVIMFSPIFAWLWVWLAKRNRNPSTPAKFSLGLFFLALGYAVMVGASMIVVAGSKALPGWLVVTYFLHTFGEICLYPVGLSAVTKLAPKRLVGQMMGIWFMSLAFGNLIGGLFSGEFDADLIAADPYLMVNLFWYVVAAIMFFTLLILAINKPIRKWMGEVQ